MTFCTRGPRIFQNLMHVYIHINMKIYVFDELLDLTKIIDCLYSQIHFHRYTRFDTELGLNVTLIVR